MRETQSIPGYAKPVFGEYFADPFIFQADDAYYAVGTGPHAADGSVFRILTSSDLTNWTHLSYAMSPLDGRRSASYWAPEVSKFGDRFYLYYSVGEGDVGHRIRVAVSDHPAGPYEDLSVITSESISFAIDPHVYHHHDGSSYLYYATDFLDGVRPGTGLVVDRMLSPTTLEGKPRVVARSNADWQRYQANRNIYGGIYDWHTMEGPTAIWHADKLYVLFSGGNWQNDSYGVDFVTAPHPLGPYSTADSQSPRLMRTGLDGLIGPGHNSLLTKQGEVITAFHAWNSERKDRLMHVGGIEWTSDGPRLR